MGTDEEQADALATIADERSADVTEDGEDAAGFGHGSSTGDPGDWTVEPAEVDPGDDGEEES
ncbi:MAG: hypothetical protein ACRDQA_12495 [Nocardioidaceae bacterium]